MNEVQIIKEWMPTPIAEFQAVSKPKEYTDLIECRSPKFMPFINRYGRQALQDIFSMTLVQLSDGLGLPVQGGQIDDAVDLIIDDYPDTKLSDLILFKREMLKGKLGGQVDDKLWKWNTRSICQAWGEYYAKREDAFCEVRERKYSQEKNEFNTGLARSFANASPEQKEKHREFVAKMEQLAESKRVKYEDEKAVIRQKLTIEEIAESEGVDFEELAGAIRSKAERRQAEENLSVPIMLLLQAEMASTLFEARKDPKYLHRLIQCQKQTA